MTDPRDKTTDPVSIYYAVPLQGPLTERTIDCHYFQLLPDGTWLSTPSSQLRTWCHDFIVLRQPPYDEAVKHEPEADPTVKLFAAVAKTRQAEESMSNLIPALDRTLTITAYPKTTRSVVLVFERLEPADHAGELVATTDPDVPHGSDGG
jgi:hypothetical protein